MLLVFVTTIWSDIKVQIHTITGGKDYKQVSNFGNIVI